MSRVGCAGATIKDIAAAANVNRKFIYQHYGAKDRLILAACRYAIRAIEEAIESAQSRTDPRTAREAARSQYRVALEFAEQCPHLVGVLEVADQELAREARLELQPTLADLLKRLSRPAAGRWRSLDVEPKTAELLGAIQWALFRVLARQSRDPLVDRDNTIEVLTEVTVAGYAAVLRNLPHLRSAEEQGAGGSPRSTRTP